jgi:peptidoglycan/xylan/chitin deacetylase (PgdA/CDA1 family)
LEKLFEILKVDLREIMPCSQMLNWEQIKEMHESGLVSFGAHTISHPILTRISLESAENEISHSKNEIEKILNYKIKYFSYPNGSKADYNELIIELVKKSGYDYAFTTGGSDVVSYGRYEIPRESFAKDPFFIFALRMSGVFILIAWLNNMRKKVRGTG